jgi:hypothetical protein
LNLVGRHMQENDRSEEELAVDLSALLGRKITPAGVRVMSRRKNAPKSWVDALGLAPEEEGAASFLTDEPQQGDFDSPLTREDDNPPTAPSGDKIIRPARPGVPNLSAKKRIEMAYGAIGSGATLLTGNRGYEGVAESYAPEIAQAWISAAEQNERVAKIVRFMESGGAVGELVVCHVLLVLGLVYVSGKGPQLDFIYGSKFGGYRAAAAAAHINAEAEAHLNGSGGSSAEGVMGEPAL